MKKNKHSHYKNPTIIEAIIEVRFEKALSESNLEKLSYHVVQFYFHQNKKFHHLLLKMNNSEILYLESHLFHPNELLL